MHSVPPDAQHPGGRAGHIDDGPVGPAHQQPAAVTGAGLELDIGQRRGVGQHLGHQACQIATRRRFDRRHDAAHRGLAEQCAGFMAEQLFGKRVGVVDGRVGVVDGAVRSQSQDDHVGVGDQLPVVGLAQADGLFGQHALGNVGRCTDRQHRCAVGQSLGDRADGVQPDIMTVGVAKPVLRFEDGRAGGADRLLHAGLELGGLELGQIVRVDARHPRGQRVQHVVGPQPQDGQHAPIEGQAAGGEVKLPVHDLGHVDRQLQALFDALAPGQVMADAEHADRAAITREEGDLGGLHQLAMAVIGKRHPLFVLDGYAPVAWMATPRSMAVRSRVR